MIGGLLARFATPLLLAALVAAGGGLIWNGIALKRAERAQEKAEARAAAAERAFDELVADYNEQARAADERELNRFIEGNSHRMAYDAVNAPTLLVEYAPELRAIESNWPKIKFHALREHAGLVFQQRMG